MTDNVKRLQDAIVTEARDYGHGLTCAQMDRAATADGLDPSGPHWLTTAGLESRGIYIWGGWSEDMITAVIELGRAGVLVEEPTEPVVYAIDGVVPAMPVATDPDAESSEDQWLPVAYNHGPGMDAYTVEPLPATSPPGTLW